MDLLIIAVAGLLAIAGATQISDRVRVAPALLLLAAGIVVGFLPAVPAIEIEPEIILEGVPLTRTATGFGDGHDRRHNAEAQVRRLLPPEVFNRLDALVLMAGLDRPRMSAVLDSVLADLSQVVGAAGYELEVAARVRERLLVEALTRPDGARRLQRTVEQSL